MFEVNEYVVYKKNVCRIKEIKEINNKKYYVLIPIHDDSLTISVIYNENNCVLRKIISKEESENIIKTIPKIDIIRVNDKIIENEYKLLLSTGKLEDLIKIIKTTYLRNQERVSNNKKIGEKDDNYFNKAEKMLYSELAISLDMSYDDAKKYVIDQVEKLIK